MSNCYIGHCAYYLDIAQFTAMLFEVDYASVYHMPFRIEVSFAYDSGKRLRVDGHMASYHSCSPALPA